jgi:hypothetical protein
MMLGDHEAETELFISLLAVLGGDVGDSSVTG